MNGSWGLLASASYVPRHRVDRREIDREHGHPPGPVGCRAAAGPDEDPLTLAVGAVRALPVTEVASVRRLFLASTTAPFADKVNATTVHAASGLRPDCVPVDLAGLRGGAGAVGLAAETGGLAVLSDVRTYRPGTPNERAAGDAAAALVFGTGNPLASVLGSASINVEVMDWWRSPGERYAEQWEERFLEHALGDRGNDLRAQLETALEPDGEPTLIVAAPLPRLASRIASGLGWRLSPVQAGHLNQVGYAGAAESGLLLHAALVAAQPGERILLVSAVGGLDALLFEVLRPADAGALEPTVHPTPYLRYLTWRGLVDRDPGRRPPHVAASAPAALRRVEWKYGLVGSRCFDCKEVYLPPAVRCRRCSGTNLESYPVANRAATVVSCSTDSLSGAGDGIGQAAQIEFDGGGRLTVELTDTGGEDVRPGDSVEMVFRRMYVHDGIPNYFWKARPLIRKTL